ncbi:hypothetical protein LCGC14_0311020 [marine sediment metagenome]|uniref:Uncharacterized protein n=1 Tax=marine sediment metagenome TaxID=412755 RepID=A0A0F9TSJ7_9ZZZZ
MPKNHPIVDRYPLGQGGLQISYWTEPGEYGIGGIFDLKLFHSIVGWRLSGEVGLRIWTFSLWLNFPTPP